MKPYVFGVDIGGTTVKLGLFYCDGKLVDKWEIRTRTEDNGSGILPDIAESIRKKIGEKSIPADEIEGIGIGVPGPVDDESVVMGCVNLGWGTVNVKERMNELLPELTNVAAGNDANVAALGEMWAGGASGHSSTVMITLGTGVGGGVVVDGRIVAGTNGGAGEIGHMTVNPAEKRQCTCGKCGCLEQYASANGIVRLAKDMLAESDKPSALRHMSVFNSRDICDLARDGEEMASDILDRCCGYLGMVMSFVSCTVDPEIFVLGGGMSRAGEVLTDRISRYYGKYAFHVSKETPVAVAKLGNDAGIYGAARMIIG